LDAQELDMADAPREAALARFVDAFRGALVVAVRERRRLGGRTVLPLDVEKPTAAEQGALWRDALGPAAAQLNGHVETLATHFDLSAAAIRSAAAEILAWNEDEETEETNEDDPTELAAAAWDACLRHARPRLEALAQRIRPAATWEDLVLPELQRQILAQVAVHVRQRATVYEDWGFAARSSRGLGISALFSGPSGTGKTMAAEVLANELGLDLFRIDLSSVVSKYIGETEKNLRKVFDAAEEGGAILLFDEADALFGKRSEVKDSHDRHANIEVGYLLQRMEAYRGLAILTTNLKDSLDPAFLRRLRFVVQFPFPDAAQREEIWRRVFPRETPVESLEPKLLARLGVAGGNIRNIALNAAFVAADEGGPVRMAHLLRAARGEYTKIEKPLTTAEIGDWES
jgi:SpoVK/Ycf46/Vps4 family AAA+-type ATPase